MPEKIIVGGKGKKKKDKKDKKEKKEKTKNKSKKSNKKIKRIILRTVISLVIISFFLGVSFSSAVYAYQNRSADKVLFGTKFLGEEIGGFEIGEVTRIVESSLEGVRFNFEIDGEQVSATPEELGIDFSEKEIIVEALKKGKRAGFLNNYIYSAVSLTYFLSQEAGDWLGERLLADFNENVEIKYTTDEEKLNKFTEELAASYKVEEKNASLVMKGSDVVVVPAVYGRELVTDAIKSQIEEALRFGEARDIKILSEEVNPNILEEDTKEAVNKAQAIISLSVTYTYQGKTYAPSKETKGGFIVFKEENGILAPEVDEDLIARYIAGIAKRDINVAAVNKRVKIINGKEEEVTREGENGLAVNTNLLAKNTAAALNAGKDYKAEIPTYVVKYKTEVNNVLVANWDKYIEIDISSQRMCAYLSGGVKVNCWAITSGANGWNTPTGTFLIRRKAGAGGQPGAYGGGVCMPNPPSTTPLCGINYVSTFTSLGHAIHEAWWRSSFGGSDYVWNGSHGCINATYDIAKFIYYWAPIGTPVVIHY